MDDSLKKAFITGLERLVARAELLDSINVFPIADGDTGRNLSLSLAPIRGIGQPAEKIVHQLLLSARGNSGNIASQFFSSFCSAENIAQIPEAVREGTEKAWQAVCNPRPGTMLSIFDTLAQILPQEITPDKPTVENIIGYLEGAVHETYNQLPRLQEAGVVDAGALGMYIFFEGFFYSLAGIPDECRPVSLTFENRLRILQTFQENADSGYCVDFVVKAPRYSPEEIKMITCTQDEVIIIPEGDFYKIHLHTNDREQIKNQVSGLGNLVNWEDDNLACQYEEFVQLNAEKSLHIITDAAGSLTKQDARKYGFTLLNSYLTIGDQSLPETYFQPEELYRAMKKEVKVSTSQASVYERSQFYESALERFEKVLYLCVGSVYTGNYYAALKWMKDHNRQDNFMIMDTGAASGRLGVIVLATVRYFARTNDTKNIVTFARKAIKTCEEYIFIDKLQYLAEGGRVSKTSAFFGEMLSVKPVVSPSPEGVKKVGTAKNPEDQIKFALAKLDASIIDDAKALIMLEYSDNKMWVEKTVKKAVAELYREAKIIVQPLSLTSGAHMGPGTWAIAFMPDATAP